MTYGRSFALVLVAFAAACSSGGGTGSGGVTGGGNEPPDFNEQAPVNGYDAPAGNPDSAPNNGTEQPEPSEEAPTAPAAPVSCSDLCSRAASAGCPADELGECNQLCSSGALQEEFGECADEYMAVLLCILSSPDFDCSETEPEDTDYPECRAGALAFAECSGELEPEPEPDPGGPPQPPAETCNTAGNCVCADACTTCQCVFPDDPATCTASCQ